MRSTRTLRRGCRRSRWHRSVFQGYTDGTFQPTGDITRAEVAAIVYRLYTGDVTDKQASLYATYNKFADMDGAAWARATSATAPTPA